ncbi:MAG: hypothetical protein ACT4QG_17765 [Sporichthyaceae bacterium]
MFFAISIHPASCGSCPRLTYTETFDRTARAADGVLADDLRTAEDRFDARPKQVAAAAGSAPDTTATKPTPSAVKIVAVRFLIGTSGSPTGRKGLHMDRLLAIAQLCVEPAFAARLHVALGLEPGADLVVQFADDAGEEMPESLRAIHAALTSDGDDQQVLDDLRALLLVG